jgi:hypothetical protein
LHWIRRQLSRIRALQMQQRRVHHRYFSNRERRDYIRWSRWHDS